MILLKNRVLVKPLEKDKKSVGGIFIPATVDKKATIKAEVVLLGQHSSYGNWWMAVGDFVNIDNPKFSMAAMNEIDYNGQKCLIINENDVNFVL